MIIGPNRYDGELLAPRKDELDKYVGMGGQPTTDAGHCHRFKFCSRTRAEQDAKEARFFSMMGNVSGFSTLDLRRFEFHDPMTRYGLDVVYTVETPFTGVR